MRTNQVNFVTCPECGETYNEYIASERYRLPVGRCPLCYDVVTPYNCIGGIIGGIAVSGLAIALIAVTGVPGLVLVLVLLFLLSIVMFN